MIMILTGRALDDFTKWNRDRQFDMMLPFEYPIYLNALIIDFFDSVGYNFNVGLSFIKTKPYKCELYISTNDNVLGECYEFKGKFLSSKQIEATEKAIEKANEIYNEKES